MYQRLDCTLNALDNCHPIELAVTGILVSMGFAITCLVIVCLGLFVYSEVMNWK